MPFSSGRIYGFLGSWTWQESAILVVGVLLGRLFRHFGEAVAKGVDNQLQAVRNLEL